MKKKVVLVVVVILLAILIFTQNQSMSVSEYFEQNGFDYNSIDEITIVQNGYNWDQEEEVILTVDGEKAIEYLMGIKDIRLKRNKVLLKSNDIYWDRKNDITIISISATSNDDTIRLNIYNSEDGEVSIRLHKDELLTEELYLSNFEDFILSK